MKLEIIEGIWGKDFEIRAGICCAATPRMSRSLSHAIRFGPNCEERTE